MRFSSPALLALNVLLVQIAGSDIELPRLADEIEDSLKRVSDTEVLCDGAGRQIHGPTCAVTRAAAGRPKPFICRPARVRSFVPSFMRRPYLPVHSLPSPFVLSFVRLLSFPRTFLPASVRRTAVVQKRDLKNIFQFPLLFKMKSLSAFDFY